MDLSVAREIDSERKMLNSKGVDNSSVEEEGKTESEESLERRG